MTATTLELDATFPEQDFILINGDQSPGRAIIQGGNSPRSWDVRKGYALSGATVVPTGDDLSKFSVRFEFWDPTQMPDWYAFAAKYFDKSVRYNPGSTTPKALGIYHPILAAPPLRITEVVIEDATQLDKDEFGLWWCEVMFLQYRKPKPAPSAPDASIPAAATATPTAEDAADAEMQQKLAEFQSLAGG